MPCHLISHLEEIQQNTGVDPQRWQYYCHVSKTVSSKRHGHVAAALSPELTMKHEDVSEAFIICLKPFGLCKEGYKLTKVNVNRQLQKPSGNTQYYAWLQ